MGGDGIEPPTSCLYGTRSDRDAISVCRMVAPFFGFSNGAASCSENLSFADGSGRFGHQNASVPKRRPRPSRRLASGLTLSGSRETCPRCGEWAELPDGTFDVIEDAIHVLSASDLTLERLLRLQAILDAANAGRMTEEDAAKTVADEAPEVASLLRRLRPKMGRALIHFLLTAVQILAAQALAEAATTPLRVKTCSRRSSER
jgi:hypothetical protein